MEVVERLIQWPILKMTGKKQLNCFPHLFTSPGNSQRPQTPKGTGPAG